ncbi:MAG: hypothetical protein FI688_03100 [SAR202 cluster bacterium]|nr:hypothetical protein [SAR202 cluster bacterium]
MANFDPTTVAVFAKDQVANFDPGAVAGFAKDQMANFKPEAVAGFIKDQVANFKPEAVAGFGKDQMASLAPEAVGGFIKDQIANIEPESLSNLKETQVANIAPEAIKGLVASQITKLPTEALSGFKPDQIAAMAEPKIISTDAPKDDFEKTIKDQAEKSVLEIIKSKPDISLAEAKKAYVKSLDTPLASLDVEKVKVLDPEAKKSIGDNVKSFENFDLDVKKELVKDVPPLLGGVGDFKALTAKINEDQGTDQSGPEDSGWDADILEKFESSTGFDPGVAPDLPQFESRKDAMKEKFASMKAFKKAEDKIEVSDDILEDLIESVNTEDVIAP